MWLTIHYRQIPIYEAGNEEVSIEMEIKSLFRLKV